MDRQGFWGQVLGGFQAAVDLAGPPCACKLQGAPLLLLSVPQQGKKFRLQPQWLHAAGQLAGLELAPFSNDIWFLEIGSSIHASSS